MATTVTTTTSYGGRLKNALSGMLMGVLMFIGGTALIFWNEGRTIKMTKDLEETQAQTMHVDDISSVDAALNGKMIHAWGDATTQDEISDGIFGAKAVAIRITRKAEYYQVVESSTSKTTDKVGGGSETVTTYHYNNAWRSKPVDSIGFEEAAQRTTNFTLATVEDSDVVAPRVTFGAYILPDAFKRRVGQEGPLNVTYTPEELKKVAQQFRLKVAEAAPSTDWEEGDDLESSIPPPTTTTTTLHVINNTIYMGSNPSSASIGDVRITFTKYSPCQASIIAKVAGSSFEEYAAKNGNKISLIQNGQVSQEAMFEKAQSDNMIVAWFARLLGVILIIAGLKAILGILKAVAMVLPFVGNIVGAATGLVSFVVGLAWALVVFAIAWLAYRPVLGVALLLAAGGLMYYLGKMNKAKKAAAAAAPVAPTAPTA